MDFQIPNISQPRKGKTFYFTESLSLYSFTYFAEISDSFSRLTKPTAIHIQLICIIVLFTTDEGLQGAILLTPFCNGAVCELPGNGWWEGLLPTLKLRLSNT